MKQYFNLKFSNYPLFRGNHTFGSTFCYMIGASKRIRLVLSALIPFRQILGKLSKVRYYVQKVMFKNIYHAMFESHLRYGCQV